MKTMQRTPKKDSRNVKHLDNQGESRGRQVK